METYILLEQALGAVQHQCRPERSPAQNRMLTLIRHELLDIPAADVAPVRHGYWRYYGENCTGKVYLCSVCRFPHNPNARDVELARVDENPRYCPHCGARMDGDPGA